MKFWFMFLAILLAGKVQSQEWLTDFQAAAQKAKAENKNILLVFSGSDWCAPCIKLDKNVWQAEAFKLAAATDWILVKADFPKNKKNKLPEAQQAQNNLLAEKFNREGFFPLVVVFDSNGKLLGKTGYENITADAYISHLKSFGKSGL